MTQIITTTTTDKFCNMLDLHRRLTGIRFRQIRAATHDGAAVALRIAQEFHRLVQGKRSRDENRAALARFHEQHCKVRVCHLMDPFTSVDTVGGYIVLSGELLGLHNLARGKGEWMLDHALKDGADRLDTLDVPHLIKLYESRGFRECLREPNHTAGQPDVVWMKL